MGVNQEILQPNVTIEGNCERADHRSQHRLPSERAEGKQPLNGCSHVLPRPSNTADFFFIIVKLCVGKILLVWGSGRQDRRTSPYTCLCFCCLCCVFTVQSGGHLTQY